MTNHQRLGAISNAHAGREFEAHALAYFAMREGLQLVPSFCVPIGHALDHKTHRFDFGSNEPAVLVECKSHHWTVTGNMPSAKVTVWNEAMYYFHLAPPNFRKVLFVLEARHPRRRETLGEYYVRTNRHLIPPDVAIIEYDAQLQTGRHVKLPADKLLQRT